MVPTLRNGMPIDPTTAAYLAKVLPLLQISDDKDQLPSVLYHYTDANGLLGILQSRKLWASDVMYLNDSKEIHYGHGLGLAFIQQFREDSMVYRSLRRGLGYLSSMINEANVNDYIVSFCAKPDLLSQWRAYGRNGTGFAIGFDRSVLDSVIAPMDYHNMIASLFPIVYGEALQAEAVYRVCNGGAVILWRTDRRRIGVGRLATVDKPCTKMQTSAFPRRARVAIVCSTSASRSCPILSSTPRKYHTVLVHSASRRFSCERSCWSHCQSRAFNESCAGPVEVQWTRRRQSNRGLSGTPAGLASSVGMRTRPKDRSKTSRLWNNRQSDRKPSIFQTRHVG